jgi:predicted acetyltransferase
MNNISISIKEAPANKRVVLENLMQLYRHDFSEFDPIGGRDTFNSEGKFEYPYLDAYWNEPDRHPLVVWMEDQPVGFALLNHWSPSGRSVDYVFAEFFIARPFRNHGIGIEAVRQIVRKWTGLWEVGATEANCQATTFWRKVVSKVAQPGTIEFAESGSERWTGPIWRFHSPN